MRNPKKLCLPGVGQLQGLASDGREVVLDERIQQARKDYCHLLQMRQQKMGFKQACGLNLQQYAEESKS